MSKNKTLIKANTWDIELPLKQSYCALNQAQACVRLLESGVRNVQSGNLVYKVGLNSL